MFFISGYVTDEELKNSQKDNAKLQEA